MNEELKKVLIMRFKETGEDPKIRQIRIPDPKDNLTGAQVKAVMVKVATKKLIWHNVVPYGAKIVQTTTAELDITAV